MRNNRFDNLFRDFINNSNFSILTPSYNLNFHSYEKGTYKARLDHCIMSPTSFNYIFNCYYIDGSINLSDHLPIFLTLEWQSFYENSANDVIDDIETNHELIKIFPNFNNEEI